MDGLIACQSSKKFIFLQLLFKKAKKRLYYRRRHPSAPLRMTPENQSTYSIRLLFRISHFIQYPVSSIKYQAPTSAKEFSLFNMQVTSFSNI